MMPFACPKTFCLSHAPSMTVNQPQNGAKVSVRLRGFVPPEGWSSHCGGELVLQHQREQGAQISRLSTVRVVEA